MRKVVHTLFFFVLVVLPGCIGTLSVPGCLEFEKREAVEVLEVRQEATEDEVTDRELDVDSEILTIDARSLHEVMIAEDPDKAFVVIDVRSFEEYVDCRMRGAVNVPLKDLKLETQEWDRGRKIILQSSGPHCVLAKRAARRFIRDGFSKVFVYEGGVMEWKDLGYEIDGPCRVAIPEKVVEKK